MPLLFAGSPYAFNDALCFLVAVVGAIVVSRHYILEHRILRRREKMNRATKSVGCAEIRKPRESRVFAHFGETDESPNTLNFYSSTIISTAFKISIVMGIVIGFLVMVQDGFRECPGLQTGRPIIGGIGGLLGFGLSVLRYGKNQKDAETTKKNTKREGNA